MKTEKEIIEEATKIIKTIPCRGGSERPFLDVPVSNWEAIYPVRTMRFVTFKAEKRVELRDGRFTSWYEWVFDRIS